MMKTSWGGGGRRWQGDDGLGLTEKMFERQNDTVMCMVKGNE